MTNQPKKQIFRTAFFVCLILYSVFFILYYVPKVNAQDSLGISITPALFQMNLNPGEVWRGQLKVINPNPYEIEYYASVVNFQAANENGQVKFIPAIETTSSEGDYTLANWIDITKNPIQLAPEQSIDIPFTINVPEIVSPGGHYAAILIGQKPAAATGGIKTTVSSFVSSLLFVRISGDVQEEGFIREFFTDEPFYQKQEVDFSIKFENVGNVHLRPVGEIVIYNMWNKKRGTIPINQFAGFGNVLPSTKRDFNFQWSGESNIFDIGRYRAELTLQYGEKYKKNLDSTLNFWIVPIKSTFGIIAGFLVFIFSLIFFIRLYIHRAFKLQARRLGLTPEAPSQVNSKQETVNRKLKIQNSKANYGGSDKKIKNILPFKSLTKNYKFLIIVSVVFLSIVFSVFYFKANLIPERSFEILIEKQGSASGEQIKLNR